MGKLQGLAVMAGVFFGIWPLLMNRSGLSGNVATAAFTAIVLIGVVPFAFASGGASLGSANWTAVALAGALGALGLLSFNGMLAGASTAAVGQLFVLMTVVQIAIPAIYHVVMTGDIQLTKLAGFAAAIVAAFLLL